jgi:hypothetical protein
METSMNQYVVVHEHEYGVSTHLVSSDKTPTVKQVVRCLSISYEPSKGESLVIDALFPDELTVLDWQDSDAEEFDEFADEDEEEGDEED